MTTTHRGAGRRGTVLRGLRRPPGRRPRRRTALAAAAAAALLTPVAWASHAFTDVPGSNPHHDDIATIARAGITVGCSPTEYCPTQPVTRQQMASFLARTLRTLTPAVVATELLGGPVDPDASPVVCQTPDFTPSVQTRAFVRGWAALQQASDGTLAWALEVVHSTDGGAVWNPVSFHESWASSAASGARSNAFQMHRVLRPAGQAVRYGLRVLRMGGAADANNSRCELEAVFTYADAGNSALGS